MRYFQEHFSTNAARSRLAFGKEEPLSGSGALLRAMVKFPLQTSRGDLEYAIGSHHHRVHCTLEIEDIVYDRRRSEADFREIDSRREPGKRTGSKGCSNREHQEHPKHKGISALESPHCADTNSEKGTKILEFNEDGANRFLVVLNKDPRKVILTVEFEPRNFEVSYIRDFGGLANTGDENLLGGKRMQYFHSKIDGEDFSFTHQGMNMTVDQLGETLIQFLLGALLV
jgi:hypothetical protein